jgi:hypothetical protein
VNGTKTRERPPLRAPTAIVVVALAGPL